MLKSCVCTQRQLESRAFRRWAAELGVRSVKLHRKLWEHCYIAQALFERGLLRPGMRGLGFAVGREPLVALFAKYGCEVVATDLPADGDPDGWWTGTGQHAASLDGLNDRGICPPGEFRRRVSFRPVDMNHIPADLRDFDFCWSACAVEHVGTLERSKHFVLNMVDCLRPGGVGVHTTEFNIHADLETLDEGPTVLWRRRDFEHVADVLEKRCHRMAELDFELGGGPADGLVDEPPYPPGPYCEGGGKAHLKLRLAGYVTTSFGMIVERDGWLRRSLWRRAVDGGGKRLRRLLHAGV